MKIINEQTVKYYPIGTVYNERVNKTLSRECTIVDILRVYNKDNNLIDIRYVAVHPMLGQLITNYDVCATTIARNFLAIGETKLEFTNNWFTSQFN